MKSYVLFPLKILHFYSYTGNIPSSIRRPSAMKGGSAISRWVVLTALFSRVVLSNFFYKCSISYYILSAHKQYFSQSVPPYELNVGIVSHLDSHNSLYILRMPVTDCLNHSKFAKIARDFEQVNMKGADQ